MLERAGVLSAKGREMAVADMTADRWDILIQRIGDSMAARSISPGVYAESFSKLFAGNASDSGVGSLQRLLLALDLLAAELSGNNDIKNAKVDPILESYLLSMRRREVERQHVANVLAAQGFRIVGVPSLSQGARSMTTINGVQTKSIYYMPAYGGLFADLDRAAQAVFEKNLGPGVRVVPMLCGESMRRDGAPHCACRSCRNNEHHSPMSTSQRTILIRSPA